MMTKILSYHWQYYLHLDWAPVKMQMLQLVIICMAMMPQVQRWKISSCWVCFSKISLELGTKIEEILSAGWATGYGLRRWVGWRRRSQEQSSTSPACMYCGGGRRWKWTQRGNRKMTMIWRRGPQGERFVHGLLNVGPGKLAHAISDEGKISAYQIFILVERYPASILTW